jgi:hypothetical protein
MTPNLRNLNFSEVERNCRPFDDAAGLVNTIRRDVRVWSWGARNWTIQGGYILSFRVSARRWTGKVMITVNPRDLFDVYLIGSDAATRKFNRDKYTNTETGADVKIDDATGLFVGDVYLDQLLVTIDEAIES